MPIKKTGPWGRVKRLLDNIEEVVKPHSKPAMMELGQKLSDDIHARMALAPPPPLAASTVERKTKQGWDFPSRSWYQSGYLVENNPFEVRYNAKLFGKSSITVAVFEDAGPHPRSSSDIHTIVQTLEYGNFRIPPRPIFRPILRRLRLGLYDKDIKIMEKKIARGLGFEFKK